MLIVNSFSPKYRIHLITIKDDFRFAIIRGEGNWIKVFVICLIKFWITPIYYGKTKLETY
jgi:hypothetical protein